MMKYKGIALALALILIVAMAPSATAATPKPITPIPWEELPDVIEGQHHYLLLCVDQWKGKPGNLGNTDGIVLVTFDTRTKRVMLTSFIREMLVQRPDGVTGRVTYIAKNFGPEALCKTLSTHFGIKIEKYMLFDFQQIQNIIDELGGVDITVTNEEANYLKRYAIPDNSTSPKMYRAGTYHFNGHAAVIYMRIRKVGGGGDFMRTQRVRTVLSTLAGQCREITYDKAMDLLDSVLENTCLTNMSLNDMTEAVGYAMDLRGCTVEELRIPPDGAATPILYVGMTTQEVDFEACREALADYLENSFLVVD